MKKSRTGACAAMAVAAAFSWGGWTPHATAATAILGAGPVVVLPPETQPASVDHRAEIQQAVQAWRLAWELGEADTYLRFYDAGYKGDAASRQQWEQHRRQRLGNKDIGVRFDRVRTRLLADDEAEVHFLQHYTSGQHRDVGEKTLQLRRLNGAWRITGESWKPRAKQGG
ncbi:MAG TPA: hypothetical protein VGD76_20905 [Ramlibacter sp.]